MDNQSKASSWERVKSGFWSSLNFAKNILETAFVVTFIFTGVASTLIHFDLLVTSSAFDKIIGALTSAFTLIVFLAFIDRGVKFTSKSKKRK